VKTSIVFTIAIPFFITTAASSPRPTFACFKSSSEIMPFTKFSSSVSGSLQAHPCNVTI